ncbi:hypothetical protein [Dyella sp.]|uniref:hypothetical protein n=1 Tax=Dyella sp. TaxID=1869338 RepID=UPI002D78B026|nr:hypothetical protein [Dyella sp.]HET7331871.1 hypothetical protein [Dyella sp.]
MSRKRQAFTEILRAHLKRTRHTQLFTRPCSEAGTGDDGDVLLVNPADGTRTTVSDFGMATQGALGFEPSGLFVTQ